MGLVPDEGRGLPPPGVLNRNSVWLAGVGWCTAMLQNAINHRPPMKSGQLVYYPSFTLHLVYGAALLSLSDVTFNQNAYKLLH